ncbi:sulfotransferase [Limibacillus halophilus]
MAEKTFLLGVGAQKAGTTWLHSYLNKQFSSCDFGFAKEYQVWDTAYTQMHRGYENRDILRARRYLEKPGYRPLENKQFWRQFSFLASPDSYFDYFAGLLCRPDGVRVTGDITPSYMGLPQGILQTIKEGFAARGIDVKVVFILRDPVERNWSALRMVRDRKLRPAGHPLLVLKEADALRRYVTIDNSIWHTQYPGAIKRLLSVFGEEKVFVDFYETFFQEKSLRRLTDFLGLEYSAPDFGFKVNHLEKKEDLPLEVRWRIARQFRLVYEGVAERYGADFIASIWSGYALSQDPDRF